MSSFSRLRRTLGPSLLLLSFALVSLGCKKKDGDKTEGSAAPVASAETPPAEPPAASAEPGAEALAPNAGEIKRYPNEAPLEGGGTVVSDVPAHKEAAAQSEVVEQVAKGAAVSKVARSGNWTLITFAGSAGDKMGWVETPKAFGAQWNATRPQPPPPERQRTEPRGKPRVIRR